MLDFKILQYADQVDNLQKEYTYSLYDDLDGYRVISGGGAVSFTATLTGVNTCYHHQSVNCLIPGYGPNGEDGWRFAGKFNNSYRGIATVSVRAVAVKELPDPPPPEPLATLAEEPPVEVV